MDFSMILEGLSLALQGPNLLVMAIGTVIGCLVGFIPGMGGSLAISLLLPITFGMRPDVAINMLIAIYAGSMYGCSISAILFNVPGTGSASATTLDGYAMTLKGKAGDALIASAVGGWAAAIASGLLLLLVAPPLALFALRFGPPEMFLTAVWGLCVIASVSESSQVRGFMGGAIGLLLGTVGMDAISGYPRFSFGLTDLFDGVNTLWAIIGMFGLVQAFVLAGKRGSVVQKGYEIKNWNLIGSLREILRCKTVLIRSTIIGTIMGIIPGTGGAVSAWVAYNDAKRVSKHPEEFGKGCLEGVLAPETANNGVVGGALIPTLTLGIPGDAVTAILLGALLIAGIDPGFDLFIKNAGTAYSILFSVFISSTMFLIFGLTVVRYMTKIAYLPAEILAPAIVVFATIGGYNAKNSMFGVFFMVGLACLAFIFKRLDISIPAVIIGLILGPIAESNFRRSLLMFLPNPADLITRPISIVLILLIIFTILGPFLQKRKKERREAINPENC